MKDFMYFQNEEGGMSTFNVIDAHGLKGLNGWMDSGCIVEDSELVVWMQHAQVGEVCEHRLGFLVRLKDSNKSKI